MLYDQPLPPFLVRGKSVLEIQGPTPKRYQEHWMPGVQTPTLQSFPETSRPVLIREPDQQDIWVESSGVHILVFDRESDGPFHMLLGHATIAEVEDWSEKCALIGGREFCLWILGGTCRDHSTGNRLNEMMYVRYQWNLHLEKEIRYPKPEIKVFRPPFRLDQRIINTPWEQILPYLWGKAQAWEQARMLNAQAVAQDIKAALG